jgi:hypothetical protein
VRIIDYQNFITLSNLIWAASCRSELILHREFEYAKGQMFLLQGIYEMYIVRARANLYGYYHIFDLRVNEYKILFYFLAHARTMLQVHFM